MMKAEDAPSGGGPLRLDLHEVLRAVVVPKETKDGWLVLAKPGQKSETKSEPDPVVSFKLLRSMFKIDHPYRTMVSVAALWGTNGSGVVNLQVPVSNISTAAEWTSIDALFDEFFVHSMKLRFFPANRNVSSGFATSTTAAPQLLTSTTAFPSYATNTGLVLCSLFNGSGYYSGAAGMSNNPSKAFHHSSEPFTYTWRNNVKFDPRGVGLTPPSGSYWQGWTLISSAANLGGNIQARATNDQALGDGAHAYTLGNYHLEWDVSFRARA